MRPNNLYGSQAAKIKTTSQGFLLSHKLSDKAKESLKICPHTPLHPFYFDKIADAEIEISLGQLSA